MKPILFNTEMVRAILDGRKTVTRRTCKLPELEYVNEDGSIWGGGDCDNGLFESVTEYVRYFHLGPYQPGNILYVRETFFKGHLLDQNEDIIDWNLQLYAADERRKDVDYDNIKWRPSIHMPKEAARIFLRVSDVRVERLQDISEDQAEEEGVKAYGQNNCSGTSARIAFAELWDGIAEPSCEWRANPWVWVIEFERCEKPEEGINENG